MRYLHQDLACKYLYEVEQEFEVEWKETSFFKDDMGYDESLQIRPNFGDEDPDIQEFRSNAFEVDNFGNMDFTQKV